MGLSVSCSLVGHGCLEFQLSGFEWLGSEIQQTGSLEIGCRRQAPPESVP